MLGVFDPRVTAALLQNRVLLGLGQLRALEELQGHVMIETRVVSLEDLGGRAFTQLLDELGNAPIDRGASASATGVRDRPGEQVPGGPPRRGQSP